MKTPKMLTNELFIISDRKRMNKENRTAAGLVSLLVNNKYKIGKIFAKANICVFD